MASKTKKSVSISGIFKQHANVQNHTKAIKKPSKISKANRSSDPPRYGKSKEHHLAAAFSNSIESSRQTIHQNALSSIESTHHVLNTRLASTSAQSSRLIQDATTINEELLRPLDKEQLQFKSQDGNPSGIATLGDRMKRFKKIVATQEKELVALWKEWTEVQQEILDLGKEVLGPDAVKALLAGKLDRSEDYQGEKDQKMEQDLNAERARLAEEVEVMSMSYIEKMQAQEKSMDLRLKQQQKSFLQAINSEI